MGDIGKRAGNSFLSSFANDISVSRPVTGVEDVLLQEVLNTAYGWAATCNSMKTKFEMLRHGLN